MHNPDDILNPLNPAQKNAASHIDGPLLILAGAGTGKTKTITSRLAYLLSIGIDPASTLTLTFTNKAASEMRHRALSMLGHVLYPPMLSTFHKFGIYFLRQHINAIKRDNNFIVIDKPDKQKIIKTLTDALPHQVLASAISNYKNAALSDEEITKISQSDKLKLIAKTYHAYQAYLHKNNLLDFDDLLLLPYEILVANPDIKAQINDRYQYIMVDEFQDTNALQMKLLKQLCTTHQNICVVGDDDQSIYSWRGADIDNILRFKDHFQDPKIIALEDNYRSTPEILKLANTLIAHNTSRYQKALAPTKASGEAVQIIASSSEQEEAATIATTIRGLIGKGTPPNEIAILFRLHAISRALEEYLYKFNIDYKIIGGIKFYERAEIKDIIAYLRVIILRDDFSLKRIINTPKRGIGKASIAKIEAQASIQDLSMFTVLQKSTLEELADVVGKKNATTLKAFIADILALEQIQDQSPLDFIEKLEERFLLKEYYHAMTDGMDKVANINEFYEYFQESMEQQTTVVDFLNDITLQSDQDKVDGQCVYMMSIHASKGLEFDQVFLVGLENGVFPIISDDVDLEEERRLAYVAVTRAKANLHLCYSTGRLYKGRYTQLSKSLFLVNMSQKPNGQTTKHDLDQSAVAGVGFKIGDAVKHKVFGMGKVEQVIAIANATKVRVNFGGTRRDLVAQYLQKL